MGASVVELRGAGVILAGRRVLHDIDFALAPGEHWAVFGANGAGKTTFLRLLAGLQWPAPPPGARIYDFGAGPEQHAVTALRRMRLVGPELHDRYPGLRWNQTVATAIATGLDDSPILRRALTDAERARLHRLAARFRLAELLGRRFLSLSRGQQRRVLLVRALMAEPEVLLLDEVCDGLDAATRDELLGYLDGECARGLQLVFATHRHDERPRVLNRCVELRHGRIAKTGVLGKPAAARAASGVQAAAPAPQNIAPLIEIRNARLYRGERCVIRALNWALLPGQHWRVCGANGAGKSTFLKTLYGDLRPARGGTITWFGSDARANVWQLRRRIGMVSDELQSLYRDRVSVAECVATGFNASIGRVPPLDEVQRNALSEVLAEHGLDGLRDADVRRLSYGQFRRVLIARACVQRPRVLLLDEPLSGLDAENQAAIWTRLSELIAAGTQLVMASHETDTGLLQFDHELRIAGGYAREVG